MSTEPPDTTEAVMNLLQFGGVEAPTTTAIAAITAHRKALADAGWVEVPKVKIGKADPVMNDPEFCNGWNMATQYLQSLGLPIELDGS